MGRILTPFGCAVPPTSMPWASCPRKCSGMQNLIFVGLFSTKGTKNESRKKGKPPKAHPEEDHAGHGVSAGNGYRLSKKRVCGQASFMGNLRMFFVELKGLAKICLAKAVSSNL